MGVNQENLSFRQHQTIHASVNRHVLGAAGVATSALANDLVDVMQMHGGGAPSATNHAVNVALVQQHGRNQRQTAAHLDLGDLHGDALAFGHAVVGLPEIAVAAVLLDVDHVVVQLFLQAQAEFLDALGNDGGAANQGGARQTFVHHNLTGAQHALFFTLSIGYALLGCCFGRHEDGLHDGARGIYKALQALAIGIHVQDRAQCNPAVCGGLRDSRRDFHHQPRIKWFRNDVFRAKRQLLTDIGRSHHLALLGLGQVGNGMHCRNFHL